MSGVSFVMLALLLLSGCGKQKLDSGPEVRGPVNGSLVANTARTQIGVKYKSGGTTPQVGFDCSGLVYWSYIQYGVTVPRLTDAQAAAGRPVRRQDLQPGDLVVFRISRWAGLHTGIYSGQGKFIHSPSSGGRVREESLSIDYWSKRFVSGRRLL